MNTYCTAVVTGQEEIMPGVWRMELDAPEIAHSARPGQFIQLYPPDERNLLARPVSLSAIHGEGVAVVYRVVGKGTEQFSRLRKDDTVRAMGPLGNGFTLPEEKDRSVIIGGGLGIPPLLELSKRIPGDTEIFLGYADAPFMAEDFQGTGRKVHIASQTGNGGLRGTVLELLEGIGPRADRAYACGPRQMLQAVSEWAEERGIPVQVSVEERMACGIGACLGCAVKIRKPGEKDWRYLRVCRDGPVFSGGEVVWNG